MSDTHYLMIADWRRELNALYGRIRQEEDSQVSWDDFRRSRDTLFKLHPQSPLSDNQRKTFSSLQYYTYSHKFRIVGSLRPADDPQTYTVDLPEEGLLRFSQIGAIQFYLDGVGTQLNLYWINGYGGGLFLPFRDATNGLDTYGGGRYLYDSIKGADLGTGSDSILLDFNFAYNPSCAYNDNWVCPLAPAENRLAESIQAGEKTFVT